VIAQCAFKHQQRRKIVMTRKIVLAVTAGILALTATACNTVRGVGQDLESVANEAEKAI